MFVEVRNCLKFLNMIRAFLEQHTPLSVGVKNSSSLIGSAIAEEAAPKRSAVVTVAKVFSLYFSRMNGNSIISGSGSYGSLPYAVNLSLPLYTPRCEL